VRFLVRFPRADGRSVPLSRPVHARQPEGMMPIALLEAAASGLPTVARPGDAVDDQPRRQISTWPAGSSPPRWKAGNEPFAARLAGCNLATQKTRRSRFSRLQPGSRQPAPLG
jgi:hypothetical protein